MDLNQAMKKLAQYHRIIGEKVSKTPDLLECEPSQALKVAGELWEIIRAYSG